MSVYRSQRGQSSVLYVESAYQLRIMTFRLMRKMPKSYRWMISNHIVDEANSIYDNVIKANVVYVSKKNFNINDYELRHRYLMTAYAETRAILSNMSFLYDLIDEGNSEFYSKGDYVRRFENWTAQADKTLNLIKGVMESDKKRYIDQPGES